MITIGQASALVEMSTDTIRMYERYGLISEPARTGNGYRHYENEHIRQLSFIKRAKLMGFTLKEVGELLTFQKNSANLCGDVKELASQKLKQIRLKIAELKRLSIAIERSVSRCGQANDSQKCPILDAFYESDEKGTS